MENSIERVNPEMDIDSNEFSSITLRLYFDTNSIDERVNNLPDGEYVEKFKRCTLAEPLQSQQDIARTILHHHEVLQEWDSHTTTEKKDNTNDFVNNIQITKDIAQIFISSVKQKDIEILYDRFLVALTLHHGAKESLCKIYYEIQDDELQDCSTTLKSLQSLIENTHESK